MAFFRFIIRFRILVILLGVLWCVGALYLGQNVKPDFSVEQFFSLQSPARLSFERYRQDFPYEDTQISIFWQESLSSQSLKDMKQMVRAMEEAGLSEISWPGNAPRIELQQLPFMVLPRVETLFPAQLKTQELRQRLQQYRNDPLYQGVYWHAHRPIFLLRGTLPAAANQDSGRARVEKHLSEALEQLKKPERKVLLSGIPIIRARYLKALAQEQIIFLGGGILLACGVMFIFFRHISQVLLCFAAIVPAYASVLAVLGIMGRPLTLLTSTLPLILLLVGMSDTIHILAYYREKCKEIRDRDAPNRAVLDSFCHFALPCFYTSATTAMGFLSLLSTGIGIVVDFALCTALGIFLTYIFAMLLFPALLSFERRQVFRLRGLEALWMNRLIQWAQGLASRQSFKILMLTAVLLSAALWQGAQVKVNSYLVDGVHPEHPLAQDLHWIDQQGFGLFQVVLYLEGSDDQPAHSLELLEWAEKYQAHFAHEDLVTGSFSLADSVKRFNQALFNDEPAAFRLPESPQALDYILQQQQQLFPELTRAMWRPQQNRAQIVLIVRDGGSAVMEKLLLKIENYLKSHPPPVAQASLTGTVSMAQDSFERTLDGFASSMAWAVALIFICMLFLLKSLRYSFIALVPNLLPLICLLAVLQLLGYALEPTTVLVFAIAYGLAVDNTIHLLGLFQSYRQHSPTRQALARALAISGRGMLMTSCVLGAGFAGLMLSSFKALFLFGLLILIALIFAVLGDLLVLPALIYALNPHVKSAEAHSALDESDESGAGFYGDK